MTLIRVISVIALLSYTFLLFAIRREFRRREVRSFALFLVGMLIWQLGASSATFMSNPETAIWSYRVVSGPGSSFALFYAQFTRDYLRIGKHRRFMQFGYAWLALSTIYVLGGGPQVVVGMTRVPSTGFLVPIIGSGALIQACIAYAFLFYAAAHLIQRFRQVSDPLARTRIRYLVIGLALVFLGSTSNLSSSLRGYPIDMVANGLNAMLIAITILRHDLFDIGRAVRKGLAYAIPTMAIATIYFCIIFAVVQALHLAFGLQLYLGIFVAAIATSLLIEPLRARVQTAVDRIFFREHHDMAQMLRRLSRTVASVLDLQHLAVSILDEITGTLQIEKAKLLLRDEESGDYRSVATKGFAEQKQFAMAADSPIAAWLCKHTECLSRYDVAVEPQFTGLWAEERTALEDTEIFIPLMTGDTLIGILALGPKRSETPYSPDEQLTLLTLANQTAVAVQNARLYRVAVAEKEQTNTVLQRAFAGILVVDPDMRILTTNRSTETITGYTGQELQGKRLPDIFDPELWGAASALRHSMETGQPTPPVEATLRGKHESRDILLGVTPVRDGYLLNFTDITRLKEVDRLKSNIVSNVSHELRTPLASIKAYTELLLDEVEGEDKALRLRFLSVIDTEADRLAQFINDLLDLSRLQSGRINGQAEPTSLGVLIDEVAKSLDIQAQRAGVAVRLDFPSGLPMIRANKDLMRSMARNLIGNAIKYSPKGGEVRVGAHVAGDKIVVEVIDQGIGIPPEDLPHLFTRFYRSWIAQQAGIRGTGLGLVVAKEAAEQHGGTIAVESQVGVGTRFTVTLPISADGSTAEPPAAPVDLEGAKIWARN